MADVVDNLDSFVREVKGFRKEEIDKAAVAIVKKIALEALRRLAQKTPVDTGRARGNWQTTIHAPANGQLGIRAPSEVEAEANGVLSTLAPYQVVYLTNNVDYIEALEDGHSKTQAPDGMVGPTMRELEAMFP